MEQYDAYKGGAGMAGQIYHPTGFDIKAGTFNPNQVVAYWKKPLIGAVASYAAQKVGAQKITNKIPILGKHFRL
jgi:hypothetical protein